MNQWQSTLIINIIVYDHYQVLLVIMNYLAGERKVVLTFEICDRSTKNVFCKKEIC